jgi:hypothetical protein
LLRYDGFGNIFKEDQKLLLDSSSEDKWAVAPWVPEWWSQGDVSNSA